MYPPSTMTTVALSYPYRTEARCELAAWQNWALALYGVRVKRIGAFFAPFGTAMTVCNFTPSRIGIITSRLTKSKLSVTAWIFCGDSLGREPAAFCADSFFEHGRTAKKSATRHT